MTIKYEEIEELSAVVSPVIAALALKAVTGKHESTDTFTGQEFQDEFSAEADRIFEGFKAALAGEEGAVEPPEASGLEALIAALSAGAEADDPFDLSSL